MKDKVIAIGGIIFVVLTLAVSAGLTYSFFTASVGGNEQARETVVELAELRLKFTDTQNIQMIDALPGQAVTKTFTVENKGDVEIEYTIDIENLTNTFVNNELVYSLTSTNGGATANRKAIPTTSGTLETATIAPGVTQTYTMTVLFKETGSNQNSNMGAIFGGVLQINSRGQYTTPQPSVANILFDFDAAQSAENLHYGYTSEGKYDPMAMQSTMNLEDKIETNYLNKIDSSYNNIDLVIAEPGVSTSTDTTKITNGLYYTEEGTEGNERVYFYRGAVTNNYLVFGNYCWRIVRTVEDGSVRLRYGGSPTQNGETYTCPQTGTAVNIASSQAYSTSYNNKSYVNYKTSDIRTTVENWYRDNIYKNGTNTKVTNLIADTPYCNDMSEPTTTNYFGVYDRLDTNKSPQYKCEDSTYAYTVAKGDLTYPVGLLTADEVAYAGGVYFLSNSSYYLYTGEYYWTMSPSYFGGSRASVFFVYSTGGLNFGSVGNDFAAVPAVSLKPEATVKRGTGAYNDPYVINTD